ncbi:hypothetical protein [Paenibacillus sp. FJAT-26967]|uniref:hypothetical protein n=1 Tax=Paenibacillus sp. FJAT-26967 TaxID=1729690 RepID=UPI000B31A74E|nr:hypothetical protein [Paenibacillus sp. FJAT-26967]
MYEPGYEPNAEWSAGWAKPPAIGAEAKMSTPTPGDPDNRKQKNSLTAEQPGEFLV